MKLAYILLIIPFNFIQAQLPPLPPLGDIKQICPTKDSIYNVGGFISSPYVVNLFQHTFKNPDILQPIETACRNDSHCLQAYNIDIKETQLYAFDKTFNKCKNKQTWFLTYNNVIPGPTIIVPTGHESLVRFNNKIERKYFKEEHDPCLAYNKRSGRPISVHLHGSASLAPFDGWAEDETCFGETKDYIYPNFRSGTGWYHDHGLHVTADNAYYGLAGMYFIDPKTSCGSPWNLDKIEEKHFILSDKLIDSNCQLYIDHFKYHQNNFYGDINLVSGIPFPNINLDPKTYRFRILNAAISRPYLIQIRNEKNQEVSSEMCYIIAADGGFRDDPVKFPVEGMRIGVAERYEIVCDFSQYKNKILYFYNDKDDKMLKDVPYFCNSHLIGKFIISNNNVVNEQFSPYTYEQGGINSAIQVFTNDDLAQAKKLIQDKTPHREFVFGRSNGHWTINGETWATMKIAANDVGQNTWEVWKIVTGGGWFHPVHIHLIDFFMLQRDGYDKGLANYEYMAPKDVMFLGPSNTLWVVARFGAHKGDYMFHCHNLIHEDNDMLRAFRTVDNGLNKQSSEKYIFNPLHQIIYNNWKYSDPMYGVTAAKSTNTVPILNNNLVTETLNKHLYRIFYPTDYDLQEYSSYHNPWKCKC